MPDPKENRWKPRFSILGFISGALWGAGGLILLQQSGELAMTAGQMSKALLSALLLGLVVPTVIRWLIVNRPGRSMAVAAAFMFLGSFGAVSLHAASPAAAQSCSLMVNGQNVASGSTVVVAEDDDLTVSFTGQEVTGGRAVVKYGPINVFSDGFTLTEPKTGTETRSFARTKIADRGVGLYAIDATVSANTGNCDFDFFINVEGAPLGTPIGKGAAALLGVGALGSLVTIGREIASALAHIKAGLS